MEIIRNEYVYITFLESTYRKRKSKSKENSERNEIRFLTMNLEKTNQTLLFIEILISTPVRMFKKGNVLLTRLIHRMFFFLSIINR